MAPRKPTIQPTLTETLDALGYHHDRNWRRIVVYDNADGAPVAKLGDENHVRAWIAAGCPWPQGQYPLDHGDDRWWLA